MPRRQSWSTGSRIFLSPIDSYAGAQGHVVLSFLTGIRITEMNTLVTGSKISNISGILGCWNYSETIVIYLWTCFCIFMCLNFYACAKYKNGTYQTKQNKTKNQTNKKQCRNYAVMHWKHRHPVPWVPSVNCVCDYRYSGKDSWMGDLKYSVIIQGQARTFHAALLMLGENLCVLHRWCK